MYVSSAEKYSQLCCCIIANSCIGTSSILNCPIVSDVFSSSDGKLFNPHGPAAKKLRGLKPTVFVLDVARSPTLADHRCRRVAIAIAGVSTLT